MPLDRRTLLAGLGATALTAPAWAKGKGAGHGGKKKNILFICIDDLNDWVGVLGGHAQAKTPNIDRLADRGLLFTNAHCAAPGCNPSRVSVLTGLRPSSTGVYDNQQPFRKALPDVATLPQMLRKQGYRTYGCGKIFHAGDPASWDVANPKSGCGWPESGGGAMPKEKPANGIKGTKNFDWGPSKGGDGAMSDDRVADQVIKWLKGKHDQPFFIGCGFFRPHLPWYVPKQYFDMYPLKSVVTPVVAPDDMNDIPEAGRRMRHIEWQQAITKSGQWKQAVQGYLASLSFADAQLGRVLDALTKTGQAQDTIIVFWTDNGWSLGTKFHWGKFALWEECTRVPIIVAAQGITTKGSRCKRPVSLLDLTPTLLDLVGIPVPDRLEGKSLLELCKDPSATHSDPVLMTWGRKNHALRDARWRYIRYEDGSEELYDHDADPHEWVNLANKPEGAAAKARLIPFLPTSNAPDAPHGAHPCKTDE